MVVKSLNATCSTSEICVYCCIDSVCQPTSDKCGKSLVGSFSFVIFVVLLLCSLLFCGVAYWRWKNRHKLKAKRPVIGQTIDRIFNDEIDGDKKDNSSELRLPQKTLDEADIDVEKDRT
jgi:hypothetical protein